ncbi:hypothetical protein DXG01_016901, partial [Tephrocybe rancida]
EAKDPFDNPVRPKMRETHLSRAEASATEARPEKDFKVASTRYIALKSTTSTATARRPIFIKDIAGPGLSLHLVKWRSKNALPILDSSGRIVALGAAEFGDPSFQAALMRITSLLHDARDAGKFTAADCDHAHGKFPSLSWGFSHGRGRGVPMNLNLPDDPNYALVEKL